MLNRLGSRSVTAGYHAPWEGCSGFRADVPRSAAKMPVASVQPWMAPCRRHTWLLIVVLCCFPACGYHVGSSVKQLPAGIRSLGVPTFRNVTAQHRLEQKLTGAVLKELSIRTRIPVDSKSVGVDALLTGEILNISSSPVTFGSDAFASAFLVTVQISAKLVRLRDSAVLWEDSGFLYRERYVLNSRVTDFFSEESPALDRLAQDFAASLVGTLLNR